MPVDTKRICGPDLTTPYYTYCTSNESKFDESQENDQYKLKPVFLQTGIVSQAKGSAYVEIGNVKIIASVYGPRENLKKQDFSINGQLNCELKYAPYSCENVRRPPQGTVDEAELSSIICDALQPAICMQKFPKSRVDIFIIILENGDNALGGAITCASLAVVDAGIEMYDLAIGATIYGGSCFQDKSKDRKESKDEGKERGSVTLGLLPTMDQVSCFFHQGEISSDGLAKAMKILIEHCHQMYPVAQKYLLKNTKKELQMAAG